MKADRKRSLGREAAPWLVLALALVIAATGVWFERTALALLGIAIVPLGAMMWFLVTFDAHEAWRRRVRNAMLTAAKKVGLLPVAQPTEDEPLKPQPMESVIAVEQAIQEANSFPSKGLGWFTWILAVTLGLATLVVAVMVMPKLTAVHTISLDPDGDGIVSRDELAAVVEVMLRTALALAAECSLLYGLYQLLQSLRNIALEQKYIVQVLVMNQSIRVGFASAAHDGSPPPVLPQGVPTLPPWLAWYEAPSIPPGEPAPVVQSDA